MIVWSLISGRETATAAVELEPLLRCCCSFCSSNSAVHDCGRCSQAVRLRPQQLNWSSDVQSWLPSLISDQETAAATVRPQLKMFFAVWQKRSICFIFKVAV